MSEQAAATILKPGHNCWQISGAERLALLVDGEAYFSAFAAAVEQARHSLFILGLYLSVALIFRVRSSARFFTRSRTLMFSRLPRLSNRLSHAREG
jgi:phosphatidylserine/phosphatidylglycerophosphate/cardiolipin synthase-like enzyme